MNGFKQQQFLLNAIKTNYRLLYSQVLVEHFIVKIKTKREQKFLTKTRINTYR
jgi:hypothetical protein